MATLEIQAPAPQEAPDYIRAGIERTAATVPPLVFNSGLAVRRGSRKFVVAANGDQSLFDLSADPAEERHLEPFLAHRGIDVNGLKPGEEGCTTW